MAVAIKALNARIRANPVADYICSTHFWGPASNFGIPIAAVADTRKDPEIISGRFTAVLCVYSAVFARYAMAVSPKNWLLFGCHTVNFSAQSMQGYRFVNYWYRGGREEALKQKAAQGSLSSVGELAKDRVAKVEEVVKDAKDKVLGK